MFLSIYLEAFKLIDKEAVAPTDLKGKKLEIPRNINTAGINMDQLFLNSDNTIQF